MGKQRLLITNTVYSNQTTNQLFLNLWLENHCKSLLDPTNVAALRDKYDVELAVFTDDDSFNPLTRHPNFMALSQICEVNVFKIQWQADVDKFQARYSVLANVLQASVQRALEREAWLGCWVADLVLAKHALPRMVQPLERGHDATFMVPIRAAADAANGILSKIPYAPSDLELFEIAYRNLHHLWVHAKWQAFEFTRMPYSMLWDSRSGLLAHNFGVTPIVFKPNKEMLKVQLGIDSDLPTMCKNPYWCTDWTEAPVAGIEPLSNGHYPPFENKAANIETIVHWALYANEGKPAMHEKQPDLLTHPLFYPSRRTFNNVDLEEQARDITSKIHSLLRRAPWPT